ncbi:hypothetical protein MAR_033650 [Mya arenaria]|uniref:Vomeronasal type-1 receptor n=1 Tax=Mya arenaria TaxID=6604 RepID=A0ABY7G9L6_MYAAR|nr:hypothetical protein MAR_033650 [Mya arenaria]
MATAGNTTVLIVSAKFFSGIVAFPPVAVQIMKAKRSRYRNRIGPDVINGNCIVTLLIGVMTLAVAGHLMWLKLVIKLFQNSFKMHCGTLSTAIQNLLQLAAIFPNN